MRARTKLVSVIMMAVMLMLSIGVANAFAGMAEEHAVPHTAMDCPCPDKADCPDQTPCQDVSACIAGCLHFFSITLFAAVIEAPEHQEYPDAIDLFAGGLNRRPPLPPPTA